MIVTATTTCQRHGDAHDDASDDAAGDEDGTGDDNGLLRPAQRATRRLCLLEARRLLGAVRVRHVSARCVPAPV